MSEYSYVFVDIIILYSYNIIIHMNDCSSVHFERGIIVKEKIELDKCDCTVIHEDIVEKVSKNMPDEEVLYDLAELFKVFGDSTRVRILWALDEAEMCVCDIASVLNMTQSAISHQLRVLKQARLVKNRREGKVVYYSLDDEHVKGIFDLGLMHIKER